MMKNAQSVANRGMDAILALMGRGVGEVTCQRIMRKVQRGDKKAYSKQSTSLKLNMQGPEDFGANPILIPSCLHVQLPLQHHLLPTNQRR